MRSRSLYFGMVLIFVFSLALSACSPGEEAATPASAPPGGPTATVSSIFAPSAPTATFEFTRTPTLVPTETPEATATLAAAAETSTPEPVTATPDGPTLTPTKSLMLPLTGTQNVTSFPDPSVFQWQKVMDDRANPVDVQFLPGALFADGVMRAYVVEKRGVIQVVKNGQALNQPFLIIQSRVLSSGNEQGLLGLAFDPNYQYNGFFFVYYIDLSGNTVISRFKISAGDPDMADNNSELVLFRATQPFANHNGGMMIFGPDGYLYSGLGDGGSAGDPMENAQNKNTPLGKILRFDINTGGTPEQPYGIPQDNAYAGGDGLPEIWALGLRNPWRFSFDKGTGDLYIADVGQNQWEEINFVPAYSPAGLNFGWNFREGMHEFKGAPPEGAQLTEPVYEYGHDQGCSVTGGYVYRGQSLPEFQGVYLFADYCSGYIFGLLRGADGAWQAQKLFEESMNITSFGQDPNGEVYIVDSKSGAIYQLARR